MKQLTFTERVFRVVQNIPKGSVLTYQQVAMAAGSPRAYRAVGNILKTNFDPSIPCHRVIRANGTLGGYNRGRKKKYLILKRENAL
jgi:methylated-DNA-[protein]-cysteine S-methyltransferase